MLSKIQEKNIKCSSVRFQWKSLQIKSLLVLTFRHQLIEAEISLEEIVLSRLKPHQSEVKNALSNNCKNEQHRIEISHFKDSLVQGEDRLEELRNENVARRSPLQIPPSLLQKADPESAEKIRKIQFEHERLRQVGCSIIICLTEPLKDKNALD